MVETVWRTPLENTLRRPYGAALPPQLRRSEVSDRKTSGEARRAGVLITAVNLQLQDKYRVPYGRNDMEDTSGE